MNLDALVRGAEIHQHRRRMLFQHVTNLVIAAVLLSVPLGLGIEYLTFTRPQRVFFPWYAKAAAIQQFVPFKKSADFAVLISEDKGKTYYRVDGTYTIASTYRHYKELIYGRTFGELFARGYGWGIAPAVLVVFLVALRWERTGKGFEEDQHVRGSVERVTGPALAKMLRKAKQAGDFSIAGVPLLPEGETQGILDVGSVGTGKSTALKDTCDQVRAKRQRMMILDLSGEYIGPYYREGHDIILNPLDLRCPRWSLLNEVGTEASYDLFAASLIPLQPSSEPFWQSSARELVASVVQQLAKSGRTSNAELYEVMVSHTIAEISALVQGTPARRFVDGEAAKMTLGVLSEAAPRMKAWRYLPEPTDEDRGFSIRKWVQDDSSDRWVFLACTEELFDLVKPLLTLWFDLAGSAILSLPEDPEHRRRIWLCLDEITSLDRLTSLPKLLRRGRKHGQCVMLGLQTMADFRAIYGAELADGIFNTLHTRLVLGAREPRTAKWLSEMLGQAEVQEPQEGHSMGADNRADRTNVARRRTLRPIILDSEILNLPKMQGFLSLPEGWPVAEVSFDWKKRPYGAEHFVPRQEGPPT